MDLTAIRTELADVASGAGYQSWSYEPDDPKALPAAVVGGIRGMQRLNRLVTQFQLGITFYTNCSNPEDATTFLDHTISTDTDGTSFFDQLDARSAIDSPAPPWSSVRFSEAGPYQRVAMPGGGVALSVEVVLEFTAGPSQG